MDDREQPDKQPKRYGKRPLWQWVAIYLVVGAIVYGLVYLIFFSGSYGGY